MSSKGEIEQKFNQANIIKTNQLVNQTRVFQELLMFMDYKIRNQLKTFTLMSLCSGEKTKFMVDSHFENAYSNLTLQEQVDLYDKTIQIALRFQTNDHDDKQSRVKIDIDEESDLANLKKEPVRFRVEVEKGFRSWQQIYLTVEGFKVSSESMNFDLRNYLIRRSKKKDRVCYVLEAIHQSQPDVIRFCFLTNTDQKNYLPLIFDLIERGYRDMIKRMYNIEIKDPSTIKKSKASPRSRDKQLNSEEGTKEKQSKVKFQLEALPQEFQMQRTESHFVEEIIKYPEEQNLSLQLKEIMIDENEKYESEEKIKSQSCKEVERFYKNIFVIMFPNFHLNELDHFQQFKVANTSEQSGYFIFQHIRNPQVFKLEMVLNLQPEFIVQALTNVPLYKNWHPEVVHGDIKLSISSENSAISYQKHKAYSKWYRERDFLYLRHVFRLREDYYIADKSIQNTNFIPFDTIHRAKIISQIAKVTSSSSGSKIIIECEIDHGGLINRSHAEQLTIRYLAGFSKMQSYFKKKQFRDKLKKYFNLCWRIKETPFNQSAVFAQRQRSSQDIDESDFKAQAISDLQESDVFFSIKDENEEDETRKSVHEIEEPEIKKKKSAILEIGAEDIELDEEGLIVLPKEYLKVRHPNGVIQSAEKKRLIHKYQDFLLRDVWKLLDTGGLVLINKKMMAAQDNVLSFIMSTLKKNLFSGKGALNISLPVTIFNCDSQLSRYAFALGSAPEFLEQAAKSKDPIERMKYTMILGLTHSLLFFDMEKPFNPILGQTFQCFIAGCPFYAEQISHHPPVSAILLIGRGYKIHATLQATVNIHMNSADGINLGWYHVTFDDGQQILFQTPPAQFSGFAMGDRKFQFKEKGYYYDLENNLYSEMKFQDSAGIFSSNKWKYRDQVEAEIVTVKSQYLNRFIADFASKKHSVSSKDILDRHGKIEGRWPLTIRCDGKEIYNINQNLPFQMVAYQYPLNSNTNYREDLYYRKIEDLARSQSEKERLQNIQRGDRKWRQKYHGKKH